MCRCLVAYTVREAGESVILLYTPMAGFIPILRTTAVARQEPGGATDKAHRIAVAQDTIMSGKRLCINN